MEIVFLAPSGTLHIYNTEHRFPMFMAQSVYWATFTQLEARLLAEGWQCLGEL